MAKIFQQTWTTRGVLGQRIRHVAYGYDLRANGKRERRWSGAWATETHALDELTRRLKEIEAGQGTPPERKTLGEVAEEYLRYKGDQKKRSLREDTRILKTRLLPAFGADLPVRRLRADLIAQYEKRRAGEVSAFTVSNELSVLRHMLRLSRRWGYVTEVPEIALPKKPGGRLRYLDEAELTKLLEACQQSRNRFLPAIVTIAVNTGMRKGEILGLEWERVDFPTSRLVLTHTKSGKPRGVPMNQAVYEALTALEPDQAKRQGLIFRKASGAAWGQVRTGFEAAVKKAGLSDFRFHDLRHTCASHLVMRGASLADVKEILGHSDLKMTLRYAHLSRAHLRGAVERLEGLTPEGSWSHKWSHNAKIESECRVNPCAPVAQVDRAAVS